jgi:hypothetical protein
MEGETTMTRRSYTGMYIEQTDLYRWNPTSEKKGRYRGKRKHL